MGETDGFIFKIKTRNEGKKFANHADFIERKLLRPVSGLFCIIYDCVVTKPFLRNHVLLMFTSMWGFQYNFLFTLMLLDIFSINKTLRETVQSIGANGNKIVMTIYLFFITALIYATYGLQFYEAEFEDGNACDSMVHRPRLNSERKEVHSFSRYSRPLLRPKQCG